MARTAQLVKVDDKQIEMTNLEKLLWPDDDITKADLIHYVFMVSHLLLPHLAGRPLTVTRYPDGIDGDWFYQKDCPDYAPGWIKEHTYPVESKIDGKVTRYIVPRETATLIWLANQAAIEFHPWMSTVNDPDHPDYAVIDLDPAEGAGFNEVKAVAALVKEILDRFGLAGYPKLSGATGIHIYVPLEPKYTYRETSAFAGFIGELVARAVPEMATNERLVKNRTGRVYVDHLQNLPGKTIVAAYAPRPRPGAMVSVPFEWSELEWISPEPFTIRNLDAVLDRPQAFQELYRRRQSIDHLLPLFAQKLQ